MDKSKKNKFSNNNLDHPEEFSKNLEEESVQEDMVDQSMDLQKDDLKDYKNKDFVDSVGNEYQNLMNELGAPSKFKNGEGGVGQNSQNKSVVNEVNESLAEQSIISQQKEDQETEKVEKIKTNIDKLEERLKGMREKRKEEEDKLLQRQKKMNEKLNKVVAHQKSTKNVKENDIEEDVNQGIEERLTYMTKKNLLLKEKNEELSDIIVSKNSHIARIMRELREVKAQRDLLDTQVKEAKLLLDNKDKMMKDMVPGSKNEAQVNQEIQKNRQFLLENRIENEQEVMHDDKNFWMTDNDVERHNGLPYKEQQGQELDRYEEEGDNGSLKVDSSYHPIEHGSYNLWLNDESNLNFFKSSVSQENRNSQSRKVRKLNKMDPKHKIR